MGIDDYGLFYEIVGWSRRCTLVNLVKISYNQLHLTYILFWIPFFMWELDNNAFVSKFDHKNYTAATDLCRYSELTNAPLQSLLVFGFGMDWNRTLFARDNNSLVRN